MSEPRRLALYNFGMFLRPSADPANQGFHDRNDPNLHAADRAAGFIARSGYAGELGPESWGTQVFPRFYVDNGDGWAPSTLSLWANLESLMAFTYQGIHAEAFRRGRDWFQKPDWPPYVLWWVEAGHRPNWREGVERQEYLHDHAASPFAFDFKEPFDSAGNPTSIDRDAVRMIALENQRRSRPS